ncbi:MAG: DUF1566 domain-containing protein [Prevotellaceae bacterium]|jgi:hypothetical protein|nr:DUF1566 domain-containing protein [Prevotellaceae bacterium]
MKKQCSMTARLRLAAVLLFPFLGSGGLAAATKTAPPFTWRADSLTAVPRTGTVTIHPDVDRPAGSSDTSSTCPATASVPDCGNLKVLQSTSAIDGNGTWNNAEGYCDAHGARLPTREELECMCDKKSSLPGGYSTGDYYWSNDAYHTLFRYVLLFDSSCSVTDEIYTSYYNYRCVL